MTRPDLDSQQHDSGAFGNPFSTRGRLGRAAWAAIMLTNTFVWFTVTLAALVLGDAATVFAVVVLGGSTWAVIASGIRRLHDLGHAGGYIVLGFVPVLNVLTIGYLAIASGEDQQNAFGPPPPKLSSAGAFAVAALWFGVVATAAVAGVQTSGASGNETAYLPPTRAITSSPTTTPARSPVTTIRRTTTTTRPPTTTTRPAVEPDLGLELGGIPLGMAAAPALQRLEQGFGTPQSDTGWVEPTWEAGWLWCRTDVEAERVVRWDGMTALFARGDAEILGGPKDRLVYLSSYMPDDPNTLVPITNEGLVVGMSVAEMFDRHPDTWVYEDGFYGPWFVLGGTGWSGITAFADETGSHITLLSAGFVCGD